MVELDVVLLKVLMLALLILYLPSELLEHLSQGVNFPVLLSKLLLQGFFLIAFCTLKLVKALLKATYLIL